MQVATFDLSKDEPIILTQCPNRHKWRVVVWVINAGIREQLIITNPQPCYLTQMFDPVLEKLLSLREEYPEHTNAGFNVIRLR